MVIEGKDEDVSIVHHQQQNLEENEEPSSPRRVRTPKVNVSPQVLSHEPLGQLQNANEGQRSEKMAMNMSFGVTGIPVTRKRTSIRRIFTWLSPDFRRRVRSAEVEQRNNELDSLLLNEMDETYEDAEVRPSIEGEEDGVGENEDYEYDKQALQEIIPKLSGKPRRVRIDSRRVVDDGDRSSHAAIPEATSTALSSPAFKLRLLKTGSKDLTDVVILYTNAMRYHSRAMYAILYSLHEMKSEVTEGHLRSFFLWFEDYHDFFCNFITLINNIYMPALRVTVPFRHKTPEYFGHEGESLNRTISKTLESSGQFLEMYEEDLSRAVAKLISIYSNKFAQHLCSYLYTVEKYGSSICSRFSSASFAAKLAKRMALEWKMQPNFHRMLPMLLRWLEYRPRTTCKWLSAHYDYFTARVYRLWRRPTEHERTLDYFRRVSKTNMGI